MGYTTWGILHTDCDKNGHYVCQVVDTYNSNFILINIYGYNLVSGNNILLTIMEKKMCYWLARFPNAYLIMGVTLILLWKTLLIGGHQDTKLVAV